MRKKTIIILIVAGTLLAIVGVIVWIVLKNKRNKATPIDMTMKIYENTTCDSDSYDTFELDSTNTCFKLGKIPGYKSIKYIGDCEKGAVTAYKTNDCTGDSTDIHVHEPGSCFLHNTISIQTECSTVKQESADCVGEWTYENNCSQDCGGGIQLGYFKITTPAKGTGTCENKGKTASRPCNTQNCPPNVKDIDCELTDFVWGDCIANCDSCSTAPGTKTGYATVKTPKSGNGKDCPPPSQRVKTESCTNNDCAVDCKLGIWSPWSECSATCPNTSGKKTRTRNVYRDAQHGGSPCNDPRTQYQNCNIVCESNNTTQSVSNDVLEFDMEFNGVGFLLGMKDMNGKTYKVQFDTGSFTLAFNVADGYPEITESYHQMCQDNFNRRCISDEDCFTFPKFADVGGVLFPGSPSLYKDIQPNSDRYGDDSTWNGRKFTNGPASGPQIINLNNSTKIANQHNSPSAIQIEQSYAICASDSTYTQDGERMSSMFGNGFQGIIGSGWGGAFYEMLRQYYNSRVFTFAIYAPLKQDEIGLILEKARVPFPESKLLVSDTYENIHEYLEKNPNTTNTGTEQRGITMDVVKVPYTTKSTQDWYNIVVTSIKYKVDGDDTLHTSPMQASKTMSIILDSGTTMCENFIPYITATSAHGGKQIPANTTQMILEFKHHANPQGEVEEGSLELDVDGFEWDAGGCISTGDGMSIAGDIIFASYGAIAFEHTDVLIDSDGNNCSTVGCERWGRRVCETYCESQGHLYFYPKK